MINNFLHTPLALYQVYLNLNFGIVATHFPEYFSQ